KPYSSARDEFVGNEGIFLDANENPYGQLNRYPDPYQRAVKTKLAQQKNIAEDQIFIGNGSDEAIDLIMRMFCEPGKDKIVTLTPSYGMYDVSAAVNDVEVVSFPLNDAFDLDEDLVNAMVSEDNTKVCFVCSPNNPTGNTMDTSAMLSLLEQFNGMVVIDEAYIDFSEKGSFIDLIDRFDNLIVLQTFSKAWGLAEARVGMAYSASATISWMNKVKPPYNVSGLSQQAVLKAIEDIQSKEASVRSILSEKKRMISALNNLPGVRHIYPSDTNFLLIKVTQCATLFRALIEEKIVVRDRSQAVDSCLRITIGTPEENDEVIQSLIQFYNEESPVYR
ncbi:MAG: histidinol-phosphate transaminase, partial [Flavobacteriales bacterium]|nr:histidinol-phosphate transaminase [Flavobacteriales bacterium]